MARWLTNEEMALLDAGLRPVLYCSPLNSEEPMDLCIGWASNEDEACAMLRRHPKVAPNIGVLPDQPNYPLIGAVKRPIGVGDEHGRWSPFRHAPCPGNYYNIESFSPVYGLKKESRRRRDCSLVRSINGSDT